MTKREIYNKKVLKRYQCQIVAKEIAVFAAGITTVVGALLVITEPIEDFSKKSFLIKLFASLIVIMSSAIMAYLNEKQIKKPVITYKKSPTVNYSKEFAELQLKFEKIEEPKK